MANPRRGDSSLVELLLAHGADPNSFIDSSRSAAHGIGTPEPVAVGAGGRGLVQAASFLIAREPEGALLLAEWRSAARDREERERGERALAGALARLLTTRLQDVLFCDVRGGRTVRHGSPAAGRELARRLAASLPS